LQAKKTDKEKFVSFLDIGNCHRKLGRFQESIYYLRKAENLYTSVYPRVDYIKLFKLMDLSYR